MRSVSLGWVVVLAACAHAASPDGGAAAPAGSGPVPSSSVALSSDPPLAPSATAAPAASSTAAASGAPAVTAAAPLPPANGLDFIDEARTLFRMAVCGSTGEIPPRFDAGIVAKHCGELAHAYDEYKRTWVDVAMPFIAALRPKDLPAVVVYPFGGGDLASALATFPDATEFTTVSLEPAGDVRPIDKMAPDRLAHELAVHRAHLERLFEKAHSRTENLEKEAQTDLPGEIIFDLAALVVHGAEPVSLHYFKIDRDGTLSYVAQSDIDGAKNAAERRALFANAELRFRKRGTCRRRCGSSVTSARTSTTGT